MVNEYILAVSQPTSLKSRFWKQLHKNQGRARNQLNEDLTGKKNFFRQNCRIWSVAQFSFLPALADGLFPRKERILWSKKC